MDYLWYRIVNMDMSGQLRPKHSDCWWSSRLVYYDLKSFQYENSWSHCKEHHCYCSSHIVKLTDVNMTSLVITMLLTQNSSHQAVLHSFYTHEPYPISLMCVVLRPQHVCCSSPVKIGMNLWNPPATIFSVKNQHVLDVPSGKLT